MQEISSGKAVDNRKDNGPEGPCGKAEDLIRIFGGEQPRHCHDHQEGRDEVEFFSGHGYRGCGGAKSRAAELRGQGEVHGLPVMDSLLKDMIKQPDSRIFAFA
mgnify:CR=1 FL=1